MQVKAVFGALLTMALGSQPVCAEVGHFDCDTPGSHSAEWARDVDKPNVSVAGTVRLVEERPYRNAIPAANVFFSREPGKALVALRFIAYPENKDKISITLYIDNEPKNTFELADIEKTKDPIPFSMNMISRTINIDVAGKSFKLPIESGSVRQISLSCFSAQFKFSAVSMTDTD